MGSFYTAIVRRPLGLKVRGYHRACEACKTIVAVVGSPVTAFDYNWKEIAGAKLSLEVQS